MMNSFNPPITPAKIVQEGWRFSIPIYQRLFVWESEQIDRLLEDLWKASESSDPYYIGVITTVEQDDNKGHVFSVVDGQQRLTFLLLFFCDCLARWKAKDAESFVYVNTSDREHYEEFLRIKFLGRKSDEDDIQYYAKGDWSNISNYNFRQFHDRMEAFFKKHQDEWKNKGKDAVIGWGDVIRKFESYVYENTSFLANELIGYSNADLNLYFEKMNSTGRQLSPLDQLKGSFAKYASEWNDCFNFEKTMLETKTAREGKIGAEDDKSKYVQQDPQKKAITIDNILNWSAPVPEEPSYNQEAASFARLPMRPEVFALHALQLTLENNNDLKKIVLKTNETWMRKSKGGSEDEIQIEYSPRHLLDSFNKVFKAIGNGSGDFVEKYMRTLQSYRDWIDRNIIYLRGEMETDEEDVGNFTGLKYAFREAASQNGQKMLQLQSMLYVSSGEKQEWILYAYHKVSSPDLLFGILREYALNRLQVSKLNIGNLSYGPGMDRCVFWTLDYLLWEAICGMECAREDVAINGVQLKLTREQLDAIKHYRFSQSRSVEHLHPQNPRNESNEWENDRNNNNDAVRNSFGNLCMISQSVNSGLSNDPVDVKFAKIRYALQGHPLQSIKLLLMFAACGGEDSKWTPGKAIEHGENMLRVLGYKCDAINVWKQKLQTSNVIES